MPALFWCVIEQKSRLCPNVFQHPRIEHQVEASENLTQAPGQSLHAGTSRAFRKPNPNTPFQTPSDVISLAFSCSAMRMPSRSFTWANSTVPMTKKMIREMML